MQVQNSNIEIFEFGLMGSANPVSSIEGYFPLPVDSKKIIWIKCSKDDQIANFINSLQIMPTQFIDILCTKRSGFNDV